MTSLMSPNEMKSCTSVCFNSKVLPPFNGDLRIYPKIGTRRLCWHSFEHNRCPESIEHNAGIIGNINCRKDRYTLIEQSLTVIQKNKELTVLLG